ncbi:MAG: SH3 domain-containing protein [Anaerolineales bacterium]
MSKNRSLLLLSVLLIISLTACNLPSGDSTEVPDLALTVTAQALLLQPAAFTATPQFTPTTGPSSTPEFTTTPTVPEVTVSTNTNCRTGPGTQYDLIGGLLVGQTAIVVGKNTSTNYWIINNPGKSGTCWLWGQYATVSGNTAGLTEYAIPPTPTPTATSTPSATPTLAPPIAVENLTAAKACIPLVLPTYNYTGTISWEDKSNNEKGFNIYLNGALFSAVGPNVTVYAIPPLPFVAGTPMKLGVEAFNDAGKSATKEVIFTCP